MRRKSFLILFVALFAFVACQPSEPINPDALPANYDYAAGAYPNPVTLNGVNVRVDQARVVPPDTSLASGYLYVVVTINVTNQSSQSVSATEFRLIDEYLNLYESWQTSVPFGQELTPMPEAIGPNQSASGDQVFIVPAPALQANLRLRWQSGVHESRIDLSLGPLALPQ